MPQNSRSRSSGSGNPSYRRKGRSQNRKPSSSSGDRRGGGKDHAPSKYRAILRDVKNKNRHRSIDAFISDARRLPDPYYTSLALMHLSADAELGLDSATSTAESSMSYASRVPRAWRRAELLAELSKRLDKWRDDLDEPDIAEIRDFLYGKLISLAKTTSKGKGLSDAIQGIAPRIPYPLLSDLVKPAIGNKGFALDDLRAIIRAWARCYPGEGTTSTWRGGSLIEIQPLLPILQEIEEPVIRVKILGYIHFQMKKANIELPSPTPFEIAVSESVNISGEMDRSDTLRYLATLNPTDEDLHLLRPQADSFTSSSVRVPYIISIAGRADRAKFRDIAVTWLNEAHVLIDSIEEPRDRVFIRLTLAQAFSKANLKEEANQEIEQALSDSEVLPPGIDKDRIITRIRNTGRALGVMEDKVEETHYRKEPTPSASTPEIAPAGEGSIDQQPAPQQQEQQTVDQPAQPQTQPQIQQPVQQTLQQSKPAMIVEKSLPEGPIATPEGNHILALCDTYEGGLKPIHYRTIARTAPLCRAFNLDLALIGFPSDDLDQLIRDTITETNIGKGGQLLNDLYREGRISLVEATTRAPPKDWKELGLPVATTSHPDMTKQITLHELLGKPGRSKKAKAINKAGSRLCVIMGLGRSGLPPSLLKDVPYHLELTDANIPLETCTVMGIIAERLLKYKK